MTAARSPGRSLVHIPAGPPAPGRPREAAVPMDAVALLYEPAQRTLQRRLRRRHAQSAQAVVPCEASARRGGCKKTMPANQGQKPFGTRRSTKPRRTLLHEWH